MILLCGIPSEAPLAMVASALARLGATTVFFHQRQFDSMSIELTVDGSGAHGVLTIEGRRFLLGDFTAIYTRVMDDRVLPELMGEAPMSERRRRARSLHDALYRWIEVAPVRVVNRAAAMASNASKPYQAQIIRNFGFLIPDTLITNDPDCVREFAAKYDGRIIYKSISGVRSIVRCMDAEGWDRIGHIRWCPTQFQEMIPGMNVRVHVVGTETIATAAETAAVDYRYAAVEVGEPARLRPYQLSEETQARCVALAAHLELPFAGIDLKVTPSGQIYCFEVNPSPAFSYYQSNTGQPIAETVARYLAGTGCTPRIADGVT